MIAGLLLVESASLEQCIAQREISGGLLRSCVDDGFRAHPADGDLDRSARGRE